MRKRKVALLWHNGLPTVSGMRRYNPQMQEHIIVQVIIDVLVERGFFTADDIVKIKKQNGRVKSITTIEKLIALANVMYRQKFSSYWITALNKNRTLSTYYLTQEPKKELIKKIETILRNERSTIAEKVNSVTQ